MNKTTTMFDAVNNETYATFYGLLGCADMDYADLVQVREYLHFVAWLASGRCLTSSFYYADGFELPILSADTRREVLMTLVDNDWRN